MHLSNVNQVIHTAFEFVYLCLNAPKGCRRFCLSPAAKAEPLGDSGVRLLVDGPGHVLYPERKNQ